LDTARVQEVEDKDQEVEDRALADMVEEAHMAAAATKVD